MHFSALNRPLSFAAFDTGVLAVHMELKKVPSCFHVEFSGMGGILVDTMAISRLEGSVAWFLSENCSQTERREVWVEVVIA